MNPYTKAALFIIRLIAFGFILFGALPLSADYFARRRHKPSGSALWLFLEVLLEARSRSGYCSSRVANPLEGKPIEKQLEAQATGAQVLRSFREIGPGIELGERAGGTVRTAAIAGIPPS